MSASIKSLRACAKSIVLSACTLLSAACGREPTTLSETHRAVPPRLGLDANVESLYDGKTVSIVSTYRAAEGNSLCLELANPRVGQLVRYSSCTYKSNQQFVLTAWKDKTATSMSVRIQVPDGYLLCIDLGGQAYACDMYPDGGPMLIPVGPPPTTQPPPSPNQVFDYPTNGGRDDRWSFYDVEARKVIGPMQWSRS